jgi:hypothetical protein
MAMTVVMDKIVPWRKCHDLYYRRWIFEKAWGDVIVEAETNNVGISRCRKRLIMM